MSVQDVLQEVRLLSLEERKELAEALVDLLAESEPTAPKQHRLRELRGLGKAVWAGIDAQDYIHAQRNEWDNR
jgi:hypothetical protein